MMYNKVLVPLDRSDVAEVILAHIGELATRIGAEMILLEVLPNTGVLPTTAHQQYNEARQHLDAMAQKVELLGLASWGRSLARGQVLARFISCHNSPSSSSMPEPVTTEMGWTLPFGLLVRSATSRATYDDLTVRDVASEDLPEVRWPPKPMKIRPAP